MSRKSSGPQNRVDLLKTLPEGELREQLSKFSGDRINLDRLERKDLLKIILQLQEEAIKKLDPDYKPDNDSESNFYDYWDDWNVNNWGDFWDHDFDNT